MKPVMEPCASGAVIPFVRVQSEAIDVSEAIARLSRRDGEVGAVVSFTGLCRDEGGMLEALELEHYPGMAERAIRAIAEDAASRFGLLAITAIHRHGHIAPGENIVFVAAAAPHRRAAFEGAEFLMDYLKTDAPFWKKEHLKDGSSGDWVSAKDADDRAKDRWRKSR
jgi:molybdopterin synthase catalytic subunit